MKYVLRKFNKHERDQLYDLLPISSESIQYWINEGIEKTMNKFNRPFINETGQ